MHRDSQITDSAIRKFKGETVFGWEHEPADERPSQFSDTTQYGALWAPLTRPPTSPLEVARPRPPQKRGAAPNAWLAALLVVTLAAGAIFGAVRLLQERHSVPAAAGSPAGGGR
jgi:hypothetical protein